MSLSRTFWGIIWKDVFMQDFIGFDEKMLFEIGMTKEESELIYLIHPNFQGMKVQEAAQLINIGRRTIYDRIRKIIEKFPMFEKTMREAIQERQEFRENLRNARRFGEMQDLGCGIDDKDDTFFGENIVRVF